MELTTRSWANAEVNKRKTLQNSDIASGVSSNEVFDFHCYNLQLLRHATTVEGIRSSPFSLEMEISTSFYLH